jgi:hypothetical protein
MKKTTFMKTLDEISRYVFDNPSPKVSACLIRNCDNCIEDEFQRIKSICKQNGIEVTDKQIIDIQINEDNAIINELSKELYYKRLDEEQQRNGNPNQYW